MRHPRINRDPFKNEFDNRDYNYILYNYKFIGEKPYLKNDDRTICNRVWNRVIHLQIFSKWIKLSKWAWEKSLILSHYSFQKLIKDSWIVHRKRLFVKDYICKYLRKKIFWLSRLQTISGSISTPLSSDWLCFMAP